MRPFKLLVIVLCVAAACPPTLGANEKDSKAPPPSLPVGEAIRTCLERVSPAVVCIWAGEPLRPRVTGAIISPDGLILTCAHMEQKAGDRIRVRLADGTDAAGKVLSKLPGGKPGALEDLALIQLEGERRWPTVDLGTAAGLADDDLLVAVGYPRTGLFTRVGEQPPAYVRLGWRHPPGATPPRDGELMTTIRGYNGDSGGPLFDLGGRLVGVLSENDGSGTRCTYTTVDVLRREWKTLAPGRPAPADGDPARPPRVTPLDVALKAAVTAARPAVVEVQSRERWVGIGVVVGQGQVLTKASELGPELTVVLPNDVPARAELVATDPSTDLALLKLPASDLTRGIPAIRWADGDALRPGEVVTAVPPAGFTPPVGVVCVAAREVPRQSGVIPVEVRDGDGGAQVTRVVPELYDLWLRRPEFPLRVGDVITGVSGQPVAGRDAFEKLFTGDAANIGPLTAGESISLKYRRDGKPASAKVYLSPDGTVGHQEVHPTSYRYTGFKKAVVSDMPTRPEHCGAPVVDDQGRVVGVLVARAMFVESVVLPADEVKRSLDRLRAQVAGKK